MEFVSKGTHEERHRLVILTDLENEADDSQTMVKLLMYSNEIDIEGLIAVTSRWLLHEVFPESITDRVSAYGIVRKNLVKHATGWPTEAYLQSKVAGGQTDYGMAGVGDGKSTAGSDLIIAAVDKDDDRPIWFAINAGANTLAQALWDAKRSKSAEELDRFISKIRVYDDSGQDDAGAWMCHTFKNLFYIRSRAQVFGLFGPDFNLGPQPWGPYDQINWAEVHVRTRHGILGALYPQRIHYGHPWNPENATKGDSKRPLHAAFLEGGGTSTWIGLVNKGLFVPEEISWGGWGGRFSWQKEQVPAGQYQVDQLEGPYKPFLMYPQAPDTSFVCDDPDRSIKSFSGVDGETLYYAKDFAPLWRWRDAYTRDFQARMDWCVSEYGQANHHPVAVFMGDANRTVIRLRARAGETIRLDASASYDPNKNALAFRWFQYPEAGTFEGIVDIKDCETSIAECRIPDNASGKQLHIILDVTNAHPEVPLTAYRRIVVDVS